MTDIDTTLMKKSMALFDNAISKLLSTISGHTQDIAISALARLKGYSSYLAETHDRVSVIKTFANPTTPVDLIDQFVSMKLKIGNGNEEKIYDEISIIETLNSPQNIVISATAGYGKSMLMRYIALSLFENPIGAIPIFIECRELNRITTPNLLAYIHSVYKKESLIDYESLKIAFESGSIILLLDGYDEINNDIRDNIEDQILKLSKEFPKSSIIISGRPDDKFFSWRKFTVYRICPMGQNSVIELIRKLDYDLGTKKRFIRKIEGGLYESHESFLSTPLLATLMLLTYEENANIPDKMHLFYDKAFETLFHKHDALKEQYERQRHSNLQIDEFSKVFSAFCINTYIKEKLEFSLTELVNFLKESINYVNLQTDHTNFLTDLEKSVCLLQKEGSTYFFVHRSFQEYFTALFLSQCPEHVRDNFIENTAARPWDNVLPMLFDMAEDQIEPSWVLKNLNSLIKKIEGKGDDNYFETLLQQFSGCKFVINENGKADFYSFSRGESAHIFYILRRFYQNEFINTSLKNVKFDLLAKKIHKIEKDKNKIEFKNKNLYNITFTEDHKQALIDSNFYDYSKNDFDGLNKLRSKIIKIHDNRNDFLNDLFSDNS